MGERLVDTRRQEPHPQWLVRVVINPGELCAVPQFLRYSTRVQPIDGSELDTIRAELAAAELAAADGSTPEQALPHLRAAADRLARLIDETMAEAVLAGGATLRSAGASAGLTENAVGPRLARTAALAPYANDAGRVTAGGIRRAQYDRETGAPPPEAPQREPLRFKPRRTNPNSTRSTQ